MYNFQPLTEEEIEAASSMPLLPDGDYDFLIGKSTRKTSKSGNPMAELQLTLWDNPGKQYTVFDYLVFSNVALNIKKVSHFSKSTGLGEEYKKGEIPEELDGLTGRLTLGTQDPQPKICGGFYAKKNIVIDYLSSDEVKTKPKDDEEFGDLEIPF